MWRLCKTKHLVLNQGNAVEYAKFCYAKLDYSLPYMQSKFTVGNTQKHIQSMQ